MNEDNISGDGSQAESIPSNTLPGGADSSANATDTQAVDVAALQAQLASFQKEIEKTRKEAAGYRTKAKALEDEKMSEEERRASRLKELEEEAQRLTAQAKQARMSAAIAEAAAEAGVSLKVATRLLRESDLQEGEDGAIETPTDTLKSLMKELGLAPTVSATNVGRGFNPPEDPKAREAALRTKVYGDGGSVFDASRIERRLKELGVS